MLRYNDTTAPSVMEYYDGSAWVDLAVAGGGGISVGDWHVQYSGLVTALYVAYGGGKYVAIARGPSNGAGIYSYVSTDDGYTWTGPNTVVATGLPAAAGICFANGVFVVAAGAGITYTSTDGVSWTAGALVGVSFTGAIAGGNGKFVATRQGSSTVYRSVDGLNWSTSTLPGGQLASYALAYRTGDEFLVGTRIANNSSLYKTTNGGASWTVSASNYELNSNDAQGMVFDGTNYLFVNGQVIWRTPDGTAPSLVGIPLTNTSGRPAQSMATVDGKTFNVSSQVSTAPPALVLSTNDSFSTGLSGPPTPLTFFGNIYLPQSVIATSGTTLVVAGLETSMPATAKIS
jgi:hypothetical protein